MQSNESIPRIQELVHIKSLSFNFKHFVLDVHVSVYAHAKYHTRSTILRENLVHYMQVHVSLNLYTMEIFQHLAQIRSLSDQYKLHHI